LTKEQVKDYFTTIRREEAEREEAEKQRFTTLRNLKNLFGG